MFSRILSLFCFSLLTISCVQQRDTNNSDLKIWFDKPASEWNEALPVGNGHLGGMVFGGIESEHIQLNEESVWSGKESDNHNPAALKNLPKVRQLLFAGKYIQARDLAQQKIMGHHNANQTYQTLGDLYLDFDLMQNVKDYRRELDIEHAVARVTFKTDDITYSREVFSSAPDHALVVKLTSSKPAALNFLVKLNRPGGKAKVEVSTSEIDMSEHVGNGIGVKMFCRLKIISKSGELSITEDGIRIKHADDAMILLTAATDYWGDDPARLTKKQLDNASEKTYPELKRAHIADYRKFFKRVDFALVDKDTLDIPTDQRLNAVKNGSEDKGLIALYYQFGRYLLISSSRPGGLPANLQGIWADGLTPPWSADYHININIQMNYWPAEITNLSELHMPFIKFLDALRPNARRTAKEVYGCRGTVAHYTTDPWHFTEPLGQTLWGMWPMGMAWCCRHVWEHYAFTMDTVYLKNVAYPILKDAAEFCIDWLVKDPKTGYLVSGPSISPENTFYTADHKVGNVVMGPTMDHMIIRDLLKNTIRATSILEIDTSFRDTMQKTLSQLAPTKIGSDGRIMEWMEEFDEPEPGHRHISHLFGLYPGNQITYQKNPELMKAARKTIDYRLAHGGGHTGWSRAWIINFFARLRDGEKAYENVMALLRKSTLSNLFDTHPPFQIDGNFGGTAGITEMLLQSQAGEIDLLPALPKEWPQGYINGLCARGGFVVNIKWKDNKLNRVKIESKAGGICHIRYNDNVIQLKTEKGKSYWFDGNLAQEQH